jgi:phosphoglycerate dehydrogenase-like enzyme
MPQLEVVQTLTIGVDWIAEQLPPGVTLCNAKGVFEESTAELVVCGLLSMVKHIPRFVHAQSASRWDHRRVGSLAGATVAILGYGAIGQRVGRQLRCFDVEVIGITRSGRNGTNRLDAVRDRLPKVVGLVITVPLTDETSGLVDGPLLASLPPGAVVVNAARGAVVDSDALEAELTSGRLRAVLDVTDPEPLPPSSPLWQLENVLITPHVGGDTTRFPPLACDLVVDQIRRFSHGDPLVNLVART